MNAGDRVETRDGYKGPSHVGFTVRPQTGYGTGVRLWQVRCDDGKVRVIHETDLVAVSG